MLARKEQTPETLPLIPKPIRHRSSLLEPNEPLAPLPVAAWRRSLLEIPLSPSSAPSRAEGAESSTGARIPITAPPIQRKPGISTPGDAYEREADHVADEVMRMAEPAAIGAAPQRVQRKCASCEEEEKATIQAKHEPSATTEGSLDVGAALRGAGRGGAPLPRDVRSFFEPRFGYDFGRVRIHTDSQAASAARAVKARAYTVGRNIVFGEGEYAPATADGKRLMAHELTHVVQQRGLGEHQIQRQTTPAPNNNDLCKDLLRKIWEVITALKALWQGIVDDEYNLQFNNWSKSNPLIIDGHNIGSVEGHQEKFRNLQRRLKNLLDAWKDDDCNDTPFRVPKEAWEWVKEPIPDPAPKPAPKPKPWTAPGSAKLGAAAAGGLIGAGVGAVLGAGAGAILGGSGGTLVAPGFGTVGGGAAGGVAGAKAGAWAGAAVGTTLGAVIGWLISE
ncbi:DUF4157 domain-containing protein [Polyangium sorediatum]|uniref:DUF4157 domain-containing protein n=1 Tax=Polyangium sorediatum TaxID=889274 RepID=A0ABT6NYF3_9BACT|nr:DUF4157 domain-containing protein [Polyangium sorediatum]MDI1433354.1 DUF4157 domain-containing protein [Polyangium sorediatum]